MRRTFYHDFETGRSGFTEGDLPSGPLVEEITAREFYEREAKVLACGWPLLHHADHSDFCPCGFTHPGNVPFDHWHVNPDDEALQ